MGNPFRLAAACFLSGLIVASLSACASLPSSGPTSSQIYHQHDRQKGSDIAVVEITQAVVDRQNALPAESFLGALKVGNPLQSANIIRPGDELAIDVFEVGYALFGAAVTDSRGDNAPARAQRILVKVDEQGVARVPYAGRVKLGGLTLGEAEKQIEGHFHGLSQYPQALVSIVNSVADSVYISGAVAHPGRYPLSADHERVLDMVAIAGGPSIDADDVRLRLVRAQRIAETVLGNLHAEQDDNIPLLPGDHIELIKRPRSYSVLGASDRVNQIAFGPGPLSLSEAVARGGGPADMRADPKGVFVFRYEADEHGVERPVIYSLNMMAPRSYFMAQKFAMNDKDVLYLANSASNAPTKFINLVNQLFGPALTFKALKN